MSTSIDVSKLRCPHCESQKIATKIATTNWEGMEMEFSVRCERCDLMWEPNKTVVEIIHEFSNLSAKERMEAINIFADQIGRHGCMGMCDECIERLTGINELSI